MEAYLWIRLAMVASVLAMLGAASFMGKAVHEATIGISRKKKRGFKL